MYFFVGAFSSSSRLVVAIMFDWDREIFIMDIDVDWDVLGWVVCVLR